jgi:transcriptional regulator with XRE-family HTH domain
MSAIHVAKFDWRQKDLGLVTRMTISAISSIERGARLPTEDEAERLAWALELPLAAIWMLAWTRYNTDGRCYRPPYPRYAHIASEGL